MKVQQFTDALTGKAMLHHFVINVGQYWIFQAQEDA